LVDQQDRNLIVIDALIKRQQGNQEHELFFFSSRRRHTRWPRDWSSDVCSSDLEVRHHAAVVRAHAGAVGIEDPDDAGVEAMIARSEERRVGKECRSRWLPYD